MSDGVVNVKVTRVSMRLGRMCLVTVVTFTCLDFMTIFSAVH